MNAVATEAWGLAVDPAGIPPTLKRERRWVPWIAVKDGDKTTKIPRQARDVSRGASVNKPLEWATFDEAMTALGSNNLLSGVGFVMTGVAGIIAIDLDNCVSLGVIADWAQDVVHRLPGYWELSPSGRGLRGFFLGTLPGKSFLNKVKGVEMYGGDSPRYLTVTGHRLDISSTDLVTPPVAQMAQVYQEYCTAGAQDVVPLLDMPPPVDDVSAVLQRARRELSASHVDYLDRGVSSDHSVTLYALCLDLFNCGFDEAEVFAVLSETPHIVAVGERHWAGKALDYLWRKCVLPTKGKATRVRPEDFNDVLAEAMQWQHDNETAIATQSLENVLGVVDMTQLPGSVPPREWVWEGWLAPCFVTMLYGEGGVGKTLFAQQLQTHLALGAPFMGAPVEQARSLGLYCEDDLDELRRRQESINKGLVADPDELSKYMRVSSRLEHDNALVTFERDGTPTVTDLFKQLAAFCTEWRPRLVVLDNVGDFFAGNEIVRTEVYAFLSRLTRFARHFNCAVLLLAHPSRAGKDDGTSGSTAWSNRSRARWHLRRRDAESDVLVLETKKSNYSRAGQQVQMLWKEGVLVHLDPETAGDFLDEENKTVERLLLGELGTCLGSGDDQFSSVVQSPYYLPKKLLRVTRARRRGDGLTVQMLADAMTRLMDKGVLVFTQRGRATRVEIVEQAPPAPLPEWLE